MTRPARLLAVAVALGGLVALLPPASAAGPPSESGESPEETVTVVRASGDVETTHASRAEVEALRAQDDVLAVLERGTFVRPAIAQSVPYVGGAALHASGSTGVGEVIAVIDTGVDSDFGGAIIGSACFAATQGPGGTLDGHCGPTESDNQAFSQTCFDYLACDDADPYFVLDPEAGRPCPSTAGPDCAHGSAVAAVAARSVSPRGMAPDASVYSIRVFNEEGTRADLVDLYLGLLHVLTLVDSDGPKLPISAVNLSVATSQLFAGACNGNAALGGAAEAFAGVMASLLVRGVPTVVATGNSGSSTRTAFPACLTTAVAVGATDLDDDVAYYSNRGSVTDLFGPGSREASNAASRVHLNVPSGTTFTGWSGTSFAAPHVAGAFALIDDLYAKATAAQLLAFLKGTGVSVVDGTSAYRRLSTGPPADTLIGGFLFPASAPIGLSSRVDTGDFDGDGHADVLAHVPGGGTDRISYGRGIYSFSVTNRVVAGTYTPVIGNFRGAASSPDDIVWYAPGTPKDSMWVGQPNRSFSVAKASVAGTYTPLVGDFDGDGWDDIFWFRSGPGSDVVWYGGETSFSPRTVAVNGPTRAAVGDFDGDGRDDLFFHGPGSAADALWRGTASRGTFDVSALSLSCTCTLLAGNMNGDAFDDVFLYQAGSAPDALWRGAAGAGTGGPTNGFSVFATAVKGSFAPVVGDLDGDGFDDIVWYAPGLAADIIWLGRSGGFSPRAISINGTYKLLTGNVDAAVGEELIGVSASSIHAATWWSWAP